MALHSTVLTVQDRTESCLGKSSCCRAGLWLFTTENNNKEFSGDFVDIDIVLFWYAAADVVFSFFNNATCHFVVVQCAQSTKRRPLQKDQCVFLWSSPTLKGWRLSDDRLGGRLFLFCLCHWIKITNENVLLIQKKSLIHLTVMKMWQKTRSQVLRYCVCVFWDAALLTQTGAVCFLFGGGSVSVWSVYRTLKIPRCCISILRALSSRLFIRRLQMLATLHVHMEKEKSLDAARLSAATQTVKHAR